jgi:hypothetical protein
MLSRHILSVISRECKLRFGKAVASTHAGA